MTLKDYIETIRINEDYVEYPRPDNAPSDEIWVGDCWLFEMANLTKRRSGLPVNIYYSDIGDTCRHAARIKFQRNTNDVVDRHALVPMMISRDPQIPSSVSSRKENRRISSDILKSVRRWILGNRTLLLLCWEKYVDEIDAGANFRKLSEISDDTIREENKFDIGEFKKLPDAAKQAIINKYIG